MQSTGEQGGHVVEAARTRADIGGIGFDPITEADVISRVAAGWAHRRGGVIITPNVDIWRQVRRHPETADLLVDADVVVADGMPLVWASRLAGTALPERVAGSTLVGSLAALAATKGVSAYVVGGGLDGAGEAAARVLTDQHPGLRFAGVSAPPFGFEHSPDLTAHLVAQVTRSGAGLVLIGLGFPKQERLAQMLKAQMPQAWFLCCGGGIAMAAGLARRCPPWAQRLGLEWVVRLAQEPRRLARRYLIDDVPAALTLLTLSARRRFTG